MNISRVYYCVSWILASVLIVTLSACTGPVPVPGPSSEYWETESNNSRSSADVMPLNYSSGSDGYDFTGVIAPDDSSDDWYRLTTAQSGQLSVTLSCVDLAYDEYLYITLYDSALNEFDAANLGETSDGSVTASTGAGASAGAYFVRISADSWTHSYDLASDFITGGIYSDYWEIEDNDSSHQANEMPLSYDPRWDGYDYTGIIATADTSDDWYRLATTQSGQLSVTMSCVDLAYNDNVYIRLYDSTLYELDATAIDWTPGGNVTVDSGWSTYAETYYVRITADSWPHRYDLTPEFAR